MAYTRVNRQRPAAHHPHGHGPHPAGPGAAEDRSWTALAVLAVAQFMVILDVSVVNVALPSIGEALRFDGGRLQWVVTAYVLFTGGLMLLGGRLADLVGPRRTFAAGLGVFTAASALSGAAWTPEALIGARALQGIGAALLLPSALSLVARTYTGHRRAVALAVWGALGSAGVAVGVLLGGVITSLASWEWIFFINVPIGLAVAAALPRAVPAVAGLDAARADLDLTGAGTLMAGLIAVVYGVEGAAAHGWTAGRTLVPVAAGAVLLAAFALAERRAARPLVPPATWRVRSLRASAVVMLGATGLLVGAFFLNTLFLQDVLGASPVETGLAFLPLALVVLAAAHVASHLLGHLGTRTTAVAGLVLVTGGALLLSGASAGASYVADLLPGFLALGFGVGLVFVAVSVAAMHDVAHEHAGLASGVMTTGHELGAALGVAVLASVALGGRGIATGYGHGFLVAAGAAAVLALVAARTLPAVRPEAGAAVGLH